MSLMRCRGLDLDKKHLKAPPASFRTDGCPTVVFAPLTGREPRYFLLCLTGFVREGFFFSLPVALGYLLVQSEL